MSGEDLTRDLLFPGIDQSELQELILRHYGGAEAGHDRVVRVPRGQQYALAIRTDSAGMIEQVKSGPGWTKDGYEALKEVIRSELLDDLGRVVYKYPILVGRPGAGWFRADDFQISAAPLHSPRQPALFGDHPMVLECEVPKSKSLIIQLERAYRRSTEIVWILNALLRPRVHRIGNRPRQLWAKPMSLTSDPMWVTEWYEIKGLGLIAESFTTPSSDPLPMAPHDSYYGDPLWSRDELVIPDTLDRLVRIANSSPPTEHSQMLRAAQWLSVARVFWETLGGAYFVAHVAALEALAAPQRQIANPCPTCNKDRGPGPTQRFRDFLEQYAPGGDRKTWERLYKLRSKLIHGQHHLLMDAGFATFSTAALNESDLTTELWRSCRLAFVNWLLAHPIGS